jgi:hypothetical protein
MRIVKENVALVDEMESLYLEIKAELKNVDDKNSEYANQIHRSHFASITVRYWKLSIPQAIPSMHL